MRSFFISLLVSSLLTFPTLTNSQLPSSPISPYIPHESRTRIPAGWSKLRKYHASAVLSLRLGLTQSNIHKIEDLLMDVSHPDSPNYGDHWTPSKVAETFAPSDETVDTVRAWLVGSGVATERIKVTSSKSWIHVNVTVEEAECLLHTEYHVYQHESGTEHVACESYLLPTHVTPHVDLITPTIHFNAILEKRGAPWRGVGAPGVGIFPKTTGLVSTLFTELSDCDKQTTPACLRALYGISPFYTPRVPEKNSYGIVEYTPQAYLQSDLQMFAEMYAPDLITKSPDLVSIDGGVLQTSDQEFSTNGESNLDLQYGMALVTGRQPVTLYQVGDIAVGASFNNFLDALDGDYCNFEGGDDLTQDAQYPDTDGYDKKDCGTVKPANVISTSYGYNEFELSDFYMARQCAEYAKLGLMGVTVLYSSGDNGVAGNGGLCINPDGTETTTGTIFNPSFPSTCPFVTSVGATQVNPGALVTEPESACQEVIQSGGGFSNYFAVPDYQREAVQGYLENYPPSVAKGLWNSTGCSRGFPDLSANGANYVVAVDGTFNLVYGTSASAPVVGAILTTVNDARIAAKKSPIGFINPAIYSAAFKRAFNDITSGSNPGCGTEGFASTEGWDPLTGLGTPNWRGMMAAWLEAK